jgi:hypothetical protein
MCILCLIRPFVVVNCVLFNGMLLSGKNVEELSSN